MSQLTIFDDDEQEAYEERIAICEEAGVDPERAERIARDQIENQRHRCEVRDVLKRFVKDGRKALELYIAKVEQKRGQSSAARLRDDARDQYKKGNRGDQGVWL